MKSYKKSQIIKEKAMNRTYGKIKKFLKQRGIPIFGTIRVSSLEEAPEGYRPTELLPGAASILCVGVPLPRGIFTCSKYSMETIWRSYCCDWRNIDEIMIRLSAIIEESGEQAMPIFGCYPMELQEDGDLRGYLPLIRLAEAAGIGKMGRNGLLLNETYGPRLLLGGLVTTELLPEKTWPRRYESGCPENCTICQDQCPAGAISPDGSINSLACIKYSKVPLFMNLLKSGVVNADNMQMVFNTASADEQTLNTCSKCISSCPQL